MNIELRELLFIGVAYLLLLFLLAYAAEKKLIPEKIIRHPLVYILSLGVSVSAWAYYGMVDLARNYGYAFLAFYVGTGLVFLLSPLVLSPLLRICRMYQLSSLADLLTFRFRSPWAGSLVTLFMLLAILPLLALQVQAVSDSAFLLANPQQFATGIERDPGNLLALGVCATLAAFTILFGTRHTRVRERHDGLIATIAFESAVKLLALFAVGLVAVFGVFGGFGEMENWLQQQPGVVAMLVPDHGFDAGRTLLLIFFCATIGIPHLFHMTFAENPRSSALRSASWGFPLLLLLFSLPVLPILWAAMAVETGVPGDYFTLAVVVESKSNSLAALTFIGGLSAASAVIMVSTLALASMTLNHLILPFSPLNPGQDVYRQLQWIKRILIVAIILAGYGFFTVIDRREALSTLGLAAFTASMQFLPGTLAVIYWPGANRKGFLAGLLVGFSTCLLLLLHPIVSQSEPHYLQILAQAGLYSPDHFFAFAAVASLAANLVVFALVSITTRTSKEEAVTAEACSIDELVRPTRQQLHVGSASEFVTRLGAILGEATAQREVRRALADLHLDEDENRPYALRRLRDQIEANLSGLMGPAIAHQTVESVLPYRASENDSTEDIYFIENRLESYQVNLYGLAAELNDLRRYHRQTLLDLPIGACSIGKDNELLMWNVAMEELTGIPAAEITGSNLNTLPAPWSQVLSEFSRSPQAKRHKQAIEVSGYNRWISLHKAAIINQPDRIGDGQVILVEDLTETQMLEDELAHSERLASVGRLAAGVAHEIGNPVTGIACLAQNLNYEIEDKAEADAKYSVSQILEQTARIKRILQSLVNFSHSGRPSDGVYREPVSVAECVDEAIHLLKLNKFAKEVVFDNRTDSEAQVYGDGQRLLQVFINLLSNARDASPEQATVLIESELSVTSVSIRVSDEGEGISKQHQEKIFEPFFTTKEAGEGTGLGLAVVYSIVEEHAGQIDIDSPILCRTDGGGDYGTRFTVLLPRYT